MSCIHSLIIPFVLIIWVYYNISYLLITTSLKNECNYFSGLRITIIIMLSCHVMSCYGFSKVTTSTLILTCFSALVPYYLSKVFIIIEKLDEVFLNIPETALRQINASILHD